MQVNRDLELVSPTDQNINLNQIKIQNVKGESLAELAYNASLVAQNPVKLTFQNLEYQVELQLNEKDNKSTYKKRIIKNVSGYAMPGQTLYIMGASGAGKTSLLNILSDRISLNKGDSIQKDIFINDTLRVTDDNFGKVSGYVMQDDILFMHFTPREALTFAANLKLGHLTQEERDQRVEILIKDLGLKNAQNTVIGSTLQKTISGGERKRTAIGVELITNPSLILLDEPTSGLDSFKAYQIVKLLKKLARSGKTIISTIHQPSSESFAEFDRLLLMCDGHCVYQDEAIKSAQYFRDIGFELPTYSNPADTYMRILAINYPPKKKDQQKVEYFVNHYEKRQKDMVQIQSLRLKLQEPQFDEIEQRDAGFCQQLNQLLFRNNKGLSRDPMQTKAKVGQAIMFALLQVIVFHNVGINNSGGTLINANYQQKFSAAMQIIGSVQFLCINQMFGAMFNALLVFQQERSVFLREYANKMYSVTPYYIAKNIVDMPFNFITPMFTCLIVYFAFGFVTTFSQFALFYVILVTVNICSQGLGYFASASFEDDQMAQSIAPLIVFPFILFGGFFSNNKAQLVWLSWIQYISPIKYATEAMIYNEFTIDPNGIGNDFVNFLNFSLGYNKCIGILIALIFFFRILGLICLRLRVRKFQ